ncbi:MAG: hypothetical protein ACK5ZI_02230, partial [bacterium]
GTETTPRRYSTRATSTMCFSWSLMIRRASVWTQACRWAHRSGCFSTPAMHHRAIVMWSGTARAMALWRSAAVSTVATVSSVGSGRSLAVEMLAEIGKTPSHDAIA